jgi:hypothetical protein
MPAGSIVALPWRARLRLARILLRAARAPLR